jgi:ABC-type sugar transport system ATPase subunit
MPEATPLLSMSGIDKRFAGIPALVSASFEVGRGEVHALSARTAPASRPSSRS